jgi:hypothetical protein
MKLYKLLYAVSALSLFAILQIGIFVWDWTRGWKEVFTEITLLCAGSALIANYLQGKEELKESKKWRN